MLNKLFLGALALVLGLAITGEASAGGPRHCRHDAPFGGRPFYPNSGVRFDGGYSYSGRHHDHWGGRVWNTRYNRFHYWNPARSCYYYWCRPQRCFLPVGSPFPY